jgi:hypothetical protein
MQLRASLRFGLLILIYLQHYARLIRIWIC